MAHAHKMYAKHPNWCSWTLPSALIHLAALHTYLALRAIPLGVFIASDESASTIAAGLNLLKSKTPSGAFYG